MDQIMSVLPPGDVVLSPDMVSTVGQADPSASPRKRLSKSQRDRQRELEISEKTGRSIGEVRADLQRRDEKARAKEEDAFRTRFKSSPGFVPTFEREQHGQAVGIEEITIEEAITRPEYCDRSHQVEQRVVVPAVKERVIRAISPIASMKARETISEETAYYAERWQRSWALAEAGYRSALASGVGREPGGLPEAVVIAASDLRAVTGSVGKIGNRILTELVGQELSIQQMAEIHQMNRQEMTGVCKAVLERLVEHYKS